MRKQSKEFILLRFLNCCLVVFVGLTSSSVFAHSLDELLLKAMQSYPTILSRQVAKEAAQTDLTAAKLKFLPSLSVSTQQNQVSYQGEATKTTPATSVVLSQPIWTGGSLTAGYNKADARLSAADYAVLETREEVARRLVNVYSEWLRAYFKTLALEESEKLHENFAEMINRRNDAGVASGADRDLGVSRLMQVKADLNSQRALEKSALNSLGQLIGESVTRADVEASVAVPVKLPNREELIDIVMHISPTLHRLQFEADAAKEEANEARAQTLPQVSLQAQHQDGNAVLPGASGYDLFGLVVSYAPGNGLSTFMSAEAAAKRAEAVAFQVETAKRDLVDKLNAEYSEFEFALLKQESLQRSVTLSSDISGSYDRQYLVGRKSWLDLMNAVREQAQTKQQLADVEASLLGASRRLLVYVEGTGSFAARAAAEVDSDKKSIKQ